MIPTPSYGPCDYHCPPHPHGRVKIDGVIQLKCRFVDHHGHTRFFDIVPGQMYEIDAFSASKGMCHFIGKVVDFDSVKGIEKILEAPHAVEVGAIIVDCSDDYEAKLIKIRIENIEKIIPVETIDNINPMCRNNYIINDPFAQLNQEDSNNAGTGSSSGTGTESGSGTSSGSGSGSET